MLRGTVSIIVSMVTESVTPDEKEKVYSESTHKRSEQPQLTGSYHKSDQRTHFIACRDFVFRYDRLSGL